MLTYLLINILTIFFPLVFSFEGKIRYYKKWNCLFPALSLTAIVFLIWDAAFTSLHIWGFHDAYLLGIQIFRLPLEEILFFFCIPFSCLYIYEVVKVCRRSSVDENQQKGFQIALCLALCVLGILFYDKVYTRIVCFVGAGFVFMVWRFYKTVYLKNFHIAYIISLLPFLMINGILTGGLRCISSDPIVWYNNMEIMGIRIMTIPIEDVLYWYILFLMNVVFYESCLRKKQS